MGIQRVPSSSYPPHLLPYIICGPESPSSHGLDVPLPPGPEFFCYQIPQIPHHLPALSCPTSQCPRASAPGIWPCPASLDFQTPLLKLKCKWFMIWPWPNPTPHCRAPAPPNSHCSNLTAVPALFWASWPAIAMVTCREGSSSSLLFSPKSPVLSSLPHSLSVSLLWALRKLCLFVWWQFSHLPCFLNCLANSSKVRDWQDWNPLSHREETKFEPANWKFPAHSKAFMGLHNTQVELRQLETVRAPTQEGWRVLTQLRSPKLVCNPLLGQNVS